MSYDFNRVIERRGSGCMKWDDTEDYFGVRDVLPLWVADMDFEAPREVREALLKRAKHGIYGYGARCPGLYEAQKEWLKRRWGWEIEDSWLTVSPGVIPALIMALRAFTEPGDRVALQTPSYPPFFAAVEKNGRQVAAIPLKVEGGRYQMDFPRLEETLDAGVKLLILCSPHNPVGRVWEEEELRRLGGICCRRRVLVVSDEIHGDIILSGRHIPFPLLSPEFAGNSLVLTSTSKTFNLAGLQVSSTIIPNPELRRRYRHVQQGSGFSRPNIFGQAAAAAAYAHGEPWLEALLEHFRGNLQFFLYYLREHLPELVVIPPEGTYLVWMDCRRLGMDDQELRDFFLKEAGVAFNSGHTFGPEGRGFLRVNLACPRKVLEEALGRVQRALRARKGQ